MKDIEKYSEELCFIREEDYQRVKGSLNKNTDFFSAEELQIFTEKISVILA